MKEISSDRSRHDHQPRQRSSPSGTAPTTSSRPCAEAGAAELGWDAPARTSSPGWPATSSCPRWRSPAPWPTPSCRRLVADQLPGVDVLFLETGYHFAETLRDARRGGREPARQRGGRAAGEHRGAAGPAPGQGPVRPRPRPVLRAAQGGSRCAARWPATRCGSPVSAATRPPPAPTRR